MTALAFHVYGVPGPQGSKVVSKWGGVHESSTKVKPWREAVKAAAAEVRPAVPLDGPLAVRMVFTMRRPAGATRAKFAPDRTPDLSKLARATEDAMTDAGLWADDARVVEYVRLAKVWTGYDTEALTLPGVAIAVCAAKPGLISGSGAHPLAGWDELHEAWRRMLDAERALGVM